MTTDSDSEKISESDKLNSTLNQNISDNVIEEKKVPKKRGRKPKNKSIEEVKIPKKRGRKPKNSLSTTEPKIPKKRGRKPKDSVITTLNNNDTPIKKDNILHLKISNKDLDTNILTGDIYKYNPNINEPSPYDPKIGNLTLLNPDMEENNFLTNIDVKNNKKPSITNKQLNNKNKNQENSNFESFYNFQENKEKTNENLNNLLDINISRENLKSNDEENNNFDKCLNTNNTCMKKKKINRIMVYFNEYNNRNEWPSSSNIKCLWCCHNFDSIPCALPMKYFNDIFYVFGNFCSPECAAAYNFESNDEDKELWERYTLLNYLYSIILDKPNIYIKLAPSRLSLKIFGGLLDINEFRECNNNYYQNYRIVLPPMVSIIPSIEEIKKDTLKKKSTLFTTNSNFNESDSDLRLKRRNPVKNRFTLENCMKLNYS